MLYVVVTLSYVIVSGDLNADAASGGIVPTDQTAQQDVTLHDLWRFMEEEVYAASKFRQITSEAPASVTVVKAAEIERYGYRSLNDLIRRRAQGFYTTYDRYYHLLGVRGFGRIGDYNNRILLLVDGMPLNENYYGSVSVGENIMDMNSIARVEIVRGPGSVLYGTNAVFAVINVVTKDGKTYQGAELTAKAGSLREFGGQIRGGHNFDFGLSFAANADFSYKGGYERLYFSELDKGTGGNDGYAINLDDYNHLSASARASLADFTLSTYYSRWDKTLPTAYAETIFNEKLVVHEQDIAFQLEYSNEISQSLTLSGTASLNIKDYEGSYPFYRPDKTIYDWREGSEGRWLRAEAHANWRPADAHYVAIGLELRHDLVSRFFLSADPRTPGDMIENNTDSLTTLFAGYLQDEWRLHKVFLVNAGVRFDAYTTGARAVSPRGAVIVKPTDSTTVKFMGGTAFRAPTGSETRILRNGDVVELNKSIKPETIRHLELEISQKLPHYGVATASGFHYVMDGLIEFKGDRYLNVVDAAGRGFEASMAGDLPWGIRSYLNYTYTLVRDRESNKKLTNSPSHLLKMGISAGILEYANLSVDATYETRRKGKRDRKTDKDAFTRSHWNLNARAGSVWLFDHFRAELLVANLLDERYAHPVSHTYRQERILQDSRTILFRIHGRI